jgi:hypothetical protein
MVVALKKAGVTNNKKPIEVDDMQSEFEKLRLTDSAKEELEKPYLHHHSDRRLAIFKRGFAWILPVYACEIRLEQLTYVLFSLVWSEFIRPGGIRLASCMLDEVKLSIQLEDFDLFSTATRTPAYTDISAAP